MESFNLANSQFIDEDYNDAIDNYSKAITTMQMPNSDNKLSHFFLNRGTSYLKIKKYYQALEDFEKCLNLDSTIELAYYRKGVSYFELEEFESAKLAFMNGLKLRQEQNYNRDTSSYARYIRKCNSEITG